MQGDVPREDLIFGGIILAAVLVCVFAAGILLARFKNARHARALRPLAPVISGTIVHDGGGAATSWLTGTYRGRRVRASMTPGRNRYHDEASHRFHYFDVVLLDAPGAVSWTLPPRSETTLDHRLRQAGASDVLGSLGRAEAAFDAKLRTLTLIQEPGASWVPPPGHFEAQLNALIRLDEINRFLNTGQD